MGLLVAGNIDIHNRPQVQNPDGSISTVRSISIGTDQGEVLIPTVSDDGRIMTDEEAIDQYYATGRHLGIFDTPDAASQYANSLHDEQAQEYLGPDNSGMVKLAVDTPDGRTVKFEAPVGTSEADIQSLAAEALRKAIPDRQYDLPNIPQATMAKLPQTQDQILARQGNLEAADRTLVDQTGDLIYDATGNRDFSRRAGNFLNDVTPLGVLTYGGDALHDVGLAADRGDAAGVLAGLGSAILTFGTMGKPVPRGGGARGVLGELIRDEAGTFGGRTAKTADLDALRRAEEMSAGGASREDIWNETGWFNQHGDWKFEIPDNNLRVDHLAAQGVKTAYKPINHPELEAAYPQFRDIKVGTIGGSTAGSWNGSTIAFNPKYAGPVSARSTGGHELQHFVQDIENTPRGGSPSDAIAEAFESQEAKDLRAEAHDLWLERMYRLDADPTDPLIPDLEARLRDVEDRLVPSSLTPEDAYRRLAGEVEARNVQTRLDWTPEQRRATPPWASQDTPDEQQFVWSGSGEAFQQDAPQGALAAVAPSIITRPAPRPEVLKRFETEGLDRNSLHSPYGMVKMDRPHSEQTAAYEATHAFSDAPTLRPEDLEGSTIIPLVGDRSATGARLQQVNETPLTNSVLLEGGARYPHQHSDLGSPGAWASDAGVTRKILNNARSAGGDVYGVYSAMGPRAVDFSTMMADATLEQLDNSPIARGALRDFDKEMRKVYPDFAGISDPSRRGELEEQLRRSADLRKNFVKRMDLAPRRKAGFPDIAATRYAISDPAIRDAPEAITGLTVAKLATDGDVIRQPLIPHTTYSTQLPGEFMGGFEVPLAREDVFPDFFRKRRDMGVDPYGDRRSFEISNVQQKATPEWVDTLSSIIEEGKRLGIKW